MADPEREERNSLERVLDRLDSLGTNDEEQDRIEPHESREFRAYKEAERVARKRTWYERLVSRTAFFRLLFEDMEEDHRNAIRLLDWDIEPDQIGPAAIVVTGLVSVAVIAILQLQMPLLFFMLTAMIPLVVFYYMIRYPMLKARQKVISSSGELIQSVLYMVIYMRSSPNMEGAISFAARHLDGPVAKDLQAILWAVDVRTYTTIQEAVKDYSARWRPYHKGYVESLNLLMSVVQESNPEKRNEILSESIDRLLGYTRDRMDDFAASLKLPVMALYGIGILLPVLGTILFPLIATFMGGGGMILYLALLYNIVLPATTYLIMRNLLISRPVSFSSATGKLLDLHPGQIEINVGNTTYHVSAFLFTVPLFLLLAAWPAPHFFNALIGNAAFPVAPDMATLAREMFMVMAIAIPAGIHLMIGYRSTIEKQNAVRDMEADFPEALYELSNQLDRGNPIEMAVQNMQTETQTLSISAFFRIISNNIQESGMTFREAVFDDARGAIREYPSHLITTVMEIVDEAAQKGPQIAAQAVGSISAYLKDIEQTQHRLEEEIGDTLSSLKFLAYVLAPVIAGIAVGMGSVISLSIFLISGAVNETGPGTTPDSNGLAGGVAPITETLGFNQAIPPGLLQLVVGIYLIELAFIIGTLYVRLKEGENRARQSVVTGKILITSVTFYTLTVFTIVVIFGGMLRGVAV